MNELEPYFRSLKGETLLTATEECALAEAIARGDKNAFDRLVQANLRLVVRIAQDFAGRGLLLDDLIGEGNIGLIRAAEKYHPCFGTRFSTYASFWIKQAIGQAVSNCASVIRVPIHVLTLMAKWRKAERALESELARTPTFNEVARSLGLSEAQKEQLAKAQCARQLKLESTLAGETGRWSPVESCDPNGPPGREIESLDDQRQLRVRMECLESRERTILSLRYGLDNEAPLTLKEIGDRLGVTREWVRKIELKAIRKLRGELPATANARMRRRSTTTASRRRSGEPAPRIAKQSIYGAGRKKGPSPVARERSRALPVPPPVPAAGSPSLWNSRWPLVAATTPPEQAAATSHS
jgi:RNA polymerase primary sigma factor